MKKRGKSLFEAGKDVLSPFANKVLMKSADMLVTGYSTVVTKTSELISSQTVLVPGNSVFSATLSPILEGELATTDQSTFLLAVTTSGVHWNIVRSYAEFSALHDKLKKRFPPANIPPFPFRTFFLEMDEETFEIHFQQMQSFIQTVLSYKKMSECSDCLDFLGVEKSPVRDQFFIPDSEVLSEEYMHVKTRKSALLSSIANKITVIHSLDELTIEDGPKANEWQNSHHDALEQMKEELNALRLAGDEFKVRMRMDGSPALLDFAFSVTSTSVLTFRPIYIRKTQAPPEAQRTMCIAIYEVQSVRPRKPDPNEAFRMNAACIELTSGKEIVFLSHDMEEIIPLLSVHINRYNQTKAYMVELLQSMVRRKLTLYDPKNAEHESFLLGYWDTVFPDTPLTDRRSKQWLELGFQGDDPATDFRAMGILGLSNLVYFAKFHTKRVRDILEEDRYPYSITGVNITRTLYQMLNLCEEALGDPPESSRWDTPLFHTLCMDRISSLGDDKLPSSHSFRTFQPSHFAHTLPNSFEDAYCLIFRAFHQVWVDDRVVDVTQFSYVLEKVQQKLGEVLETKPWCLQNINSALGLI